jgi:hypothetical protein
MTWSGQAQFQTLTVVAASAITTTFAEVVLTTHPVALAAVKNGTNGDVLISINGTTAIWGFPASSGSAYDIRTNSPTSSNLMFPANTPIFISWNGSAPGTPTGNVYIEFMQVHLV